MKKFAYILIGCFAVLIISVAFIACNKKDNSVNGGNEGGGSEAGPSLIGTWKWNFEEYDYGYNQIIIMEIKGDNTGKLTIMDAEYPSSKDVCIFSWKYIYEDVVRIKAVSGYAGLLYQGETMDLTLDWYGPNTVYFNDTEYQYSDYSFGPFIRQ